MARFILVERFMVGAALAFGAAPGLAQDRADDNAVTQAEDAFGFSVGRESIGIYNGGQTRGFSPFAAGNVRIEGLYYDPISGLQGLLVDSSSIKVGLSAQGYPFVAPSGVVDQRLRRPAGKLGGSTVVAADSWGGKSVELDSSIPLNDRLAVRLGFNAGATVFANGTDNVNHTESAILRWRPTDNIELMPFWARYDDYDDESGTYYVPAGSFVGITDRPLHDESPSWADIRFTTRNAGLLANVGLGKNTVIRLGAFRSQIHYKQLFGFLMVNQQPDGSAERLLIADPPTTNRSTSGEMRLTHSIADGPRLHVLHASVRKRDAHRAFGGSDIISYGVGAVGEKVTVPEPPSFEFGESTRQRTEQMTYGVAYDGRWRDVGEVSVSLAKADYRKTTLIPTAEPATATDRPWLYNGTVAAVVSNSVSLYAGFARGLEESGTAPQSAANRNEPLDAILTQQKDAGVRFNLTKDVRAVAGVFDLRRPYFGFDEDNVYRHVGSIRSRGAEFSVSGRLTPRLSVVLGGVVLRPKVTKSPEAQGDVGSKPVGLPAHIVNFNANWDTSFLDGLQFDIGVSHRARQPSTVDNRVYLPARSNLNVGTRYGFKLFGKGATFRVQGTNLFDNNDPSPAAPGVYGPPGTRQINGFLTVDY
jgi:iron complex outermembrane receptor protein